jgi:DNA repair photolyase
MKTVRRSGQFIRQFAGPGDNNIICFKFWQAVVASGCPGECSYCFLQTQTPYRTGLYDVKGTLFENLRDIVDETKKWLQHQQPLGLIVGENQDGLAFEGPYKKQLGCTPLELLIPLFESPDTNPVGHTLIVLSKFTSTQHAEILGPSKHVVFSWSLSLPTISAKYEKKVASLEARLQKATDLKSAGYRIRFRLDAMAPIPGWETELGLMIKRINHIAPEMLTIGALRASNATALRTAAVNNGRNGSIFDYIETIDPSGFKYRTEHDFHQKAFQKIKNDLRPDIALGLCKEDATMWRQVGVGWQGCHCLHGSFDTIATARVGIL